MNHHIMETSELAVWSVMLGGLLILATVATAFALVQRSANALRFLLFVGLTGASSLMRTGLVEALLPDFPPLLLDLLKVCAGPLSAALVIRYMAIWLGLPEVDPYVHRVAVWGSGAMLLSALLLGLLVLTQPEPAIPRLLRASAILTAIATLIGLLSSLRAALQGDPLAGWAAVAAASLGVALFGLYARSVDLPGFGLGTWMLTAACMLLYFLLASMVAVLRIREAQQLDRQAQLAAGTDVATGLPTGSVLLAQVGQALRRTARLQGESTVVCLSLANLYALGETAGHGVEQQIQASLAARIRRAAGFRCVVGLYHPLCFVVVFATDKRRDHVVRTLARLRALVSQPLRVVGHDGTRHVFRPSVGVGMVSPVAAGARALDVINEAERMALSAAPARPDASRDTAPEPYGGVQFATTIGAPL